MPYYQVKYKVNSRTYNTDIEAPGVDFVKQLFKDLSVAKILEIKEYLYLAAPNNFDNPNYSYYVTVYIHFTDKPSIKVQIPKFRRTKNKDDVLAFLKTIYKNIDYITYRSYG